MFDRVSVPIIAMASGKGGVGKSTFSVNLAVSFVRLGYKVGLLDADIYGPSIPRMMGITSKPQVTPEKKILPIQRYGVQCASMGFLLAENEPVIWRGPMIQKAFKQLLYDVVWGEIDVLFIDLPPGTGDIHLSLAQQVPLHGAIIVSTPQDIALLDARRAFFMFQRVSVPVLGIIENMGIFICMHCGQETSVFSSGGVKKEASKQNIPFLGTIPLDQKICHFSEEGKPITVATPNDKISKDFYGIAEKIKISFNQTREL